ncbi:MAG: CAP domain-containing protein [Chloroflexota bacterium]|nr:CAP domain-containing protein [Chloroflexota bacterium]
MRKYLMLVAVALVTLAGTAGTAVAAPARTGDQPVSAAAAAGSYCAEPEEVAFLNLINQYRAQNGLGALRMSQAVGSAAEHHSVEMGTYNYFSHTLLNGVSWSQNMTDHGYGYNTYRGENIAAGNAGAYDTFTQWKNSPGHNANMLNGSFNTIGIGRAYVETSTYKYYWTTNFGGYVDGAAVICGQAATAPQPTTAPAPIATKASASAPIATAATGSRTVRGGVAPAPTKATSGGSLPTATPSGRTIRR